MLDASAGARFRLNAILPQRWASVTGALECAAGDATVAGAAPVSGRFEPSRHDNAPASSPWPRGRFDWTAARSRTTRRSRWGHTLAASGAGSKAAAGRDVNGRVLGGRVSRGARNLTSKRRTALHPGAMPRCGAIPSARPRLQRRRHWRRAGDGHHGARLWGRSLRHDDLASGSRIETRACAFHSRWAGSSAACRCHAGARIEVISLTLMRSSIRCGIVRNHPRFPNHLRATSVIGRWKWRLCLECYGALTFGAVVASTDRRDAVGSRGARTFDPARRCDRGACTTLINGPTSCRSRHVGAQSNRISRLYIAWQAVAFSTSNDARGRHSHGVSSVSMRCTPSARAPNHTAASGPHFARTAAGSVTTPRGLIEATRRTLRFDDALRTSSAPRAIRHSFLRELLSVRRRHRTDRGSATQHARFLRATPRRGTSQGT